MDKTTFILVRHGQTEWNQIERFRGRADVPLNETGQAQAAAAGKHIAAEWQPSAIYASPLSRALETAQAIAVHFKLPVLTHPGLEDIDYGEWQGLTMEEASQRWEFELAAWHTAPQNVHIPGGESLAGVRQRAMEMVSELASRHSGETVVLVGHTVVNRLILLGLLGLGDERFWGLRQEPCAINVFECEAGGFTLVSMNDTCHLREE